jgi:hypothetical protein
MKYIVQYVNQDIEEKCDNMIFVEKQKHPFEIKSISD